MSPSQPSARASDWTEQPFAEAGAEYRARLAREFRDALNNRAPEQLAAAIDKAHATRQPVSVSLPDGTIVTIN